MRRATSQPLTDRRQSLRLDLTRRHAFMRLYVELIDSSEYENVMDWVDENGNEVQRT